MTVSSEAPGAERGLGACRRVVLAGDKLAGGAGARTARGHTGQQRRHELAAGARLSFCWHSLAIPTETATKGREGVQAMVHWQFENCGGMVQVAQQNDSLAGYVP